MSIFHAFEQLTLERARIACIVVLLSAATASMTQAQTFTTLVAFDGTNGANPSSLVQSIDGNLYGAAAWGGANGNGTVFKLTLTGAVSTLHNFGSDGWAPTGVVQAADGNFYGTTYGGGTRDCGTIFRMTPAGKGTTLYNFRPGNNWGMNPEAGVIQATDGNLYGTTVGGYGTVFKISPGGTFTELHNFDPGYSEGELPVADLVQATDGNLYGTTAWGGTSLYDGTIFKITQAGKLTTLYNFCGQGGSYCPDGVNPQGALIQATDGNLYGTTWGGGEMGYGTVFKIAPGGTLVTLHSFDGTDGSYPNAGLVQGTDGNLYGTTYAGGANSNSDKCNQQYSGCGTIFRINTQGVLTTLHNFCAQPNCADGANPSFSLIQATDGKLYGSAGGGASGNGTVFRLSLGLRPFVSFTRPSGIVGDTVQILGQGFTGTSAVSFSGTPATFTVNSDTYLTAKVPAGAVTGYVTVTSPGATLKSNIMYRVKPQIFSISPTSGPVGTSVVIKGESFTKTRQLVFGCDDMPVSFTVDSDTQITAIIPAGAAGGKFTVRTSGGSAMSPVGFGVTP